MSETRIVSVRVMDSDQAIEELLAEKNGLIATQSAQIEALREKIGLALGCLESGGDASAIVELRAALAAVGEKKCGTCGETIEHDPLTGTKCACSERRHICGPDAHCDTDCMKEHYAGLDYPEDLMP